MNWIHSLKFGSFPSGTNAGTIGFQVECGGGEPKDLEEQVALKRALLAYPTKYKNIMLFGSYPSSQTTYTSLQALTDSGFRIEAHIDGTVAYAWLKLVNWTVGIINSTLPFQGFYVNELRYNLDNLDDPDPLIPQSNEKPLPVLYLNPSKTLQPSDVFQYMEDSPYDWRLLPVAQRAFVKDIKGGKG